VQELTVPLIKAAIAVHDKVQSSFRKTAVNFHYEFTIRHLSSIFQGILFSQPAQFGDQEKLVKLWLHESERVYADRLISPEHIATYKANAFEILKKNFAKFLAAEVLRGRHSGNPHVHQLPHRLPERAPVRPGPVFRRPRSTWPRRCGTTTRT
jgi:hypothetical protein